MPRCARLWMPCWHGKRLVVRDGGFTEASVSGSLAVDLLSMTSLQQWLDHTLPTHPARSMPHHATPPPPSHQTVHDRLVGTLDAELAQRAVEYRGLAARREVARAAVQPLPKWEKRTSLLLRRLAEKEVSAEGEGGEMRGVGQGL